MKFAAVALLLLALTTASPVYKIEWVTHTRYTTVSAGYDEYTAAFPQAAGSETTQSVATVSPSVDVGETTSLSDSTTTTATPATQTSTFALQVASTTVSTETSSTSTAEVFSGDGTYYDTGLGACGWTNTDTDYIVALGHDLFDQYTPGTNPNENTLCGKKIIASYEGKSVEVTAVDRCEGCLEYDLDFSPAAFSELADQLLGRILITWEWA